jgi:YD repeat-containing protein
VRTQTVPLQGGGSAVYAFYFSGFRNVEEDPEGNRTIYYYDPKGRSIGEENALGDRTLRQYDGQNHIVESLDPLLNPTRYSYDGAHNPIGVENALSEETQYVYDAQHRQTDATDPLGHTVHYDYDSEHHLTRTTLYPKAGQTIRTGTDWPRRAGRWQNKSESATALNRTAILQAGRSMGSQTYCDEEISLSGMLGFGR